MSDEVYMHHALALAKRALAAGEFPVGCVFVFENRVVAQGARIGSSGTSANEIDHAEIMALRQFYNLPSGCTPGETTAFCTLEPCLMCFAALVIAGIGKIVYAYEDVMGGGTGCLMKDMPPLYRNQRPLVVPHVLREESCSMFKAFFSNPDATYLKGTLLAEYTLGSV